MNESGGRLCCTLASNECAEPRGDNRWNGEDRERNDAKRQEIVSGIWILDHGLSHETGLVLQYRGAWHQIPSQFCDGVLKTYLKYRIDKWRNGSAFNIVNQCCQQQ